MRKAARVAAALAALGAPSLPAQDLAGLCRAVTDVKVGQWSSYDVSGGESPGHLRLAVIGSERVGDSTYLWMEYAQTSQDPNRSGIYQILVSGLAHASSPRGMILKTGNRPAMKMPSQMLGMMSSQSNRNNSAMDWAKKCESGQVVGWESVTVPAGTIRALHVKADNGADVWAAAEIPFGIVKLHNTNGSELVLAGHGAGAKSSITETPQEMSIPMMKKP